MTENEYEKIESWAESQDVEIWGHCSGNKLETLSVCGVKNLPSYFSNSTL